MRLEAIAVRLALHGVRPSAPHLPASCASARREKQGRWGGFAAQLLLWGKAVLSCQVRGSPSIMAQRLPGLFPSRGVQSRSLRGFSSEAEDARWPGPTRPTLEALRPSPETKRTPSPAFPSRGFCPKPRRAGWHLWLGFLLKRRILCW